MTHFASVPLHLHNHGHKPSLLPPSTAAATPPKSDMRMKNIRKQEIAQHIIRAVSKAASWLHNSCSPSSILALQLSNSSLAKAWPSLLDRKPPSRSHLLRHAGLQKR